MSISPIMPTHGSCGFSGHQAAHEDLGTGDGGAESLAEAYLCGSQAKPRQLLSSCLALWHALRAQSRQKSWLAEEVLLASCSRLQNILFPQLTLLALCGLNTYTQNQWDRHCTFRGLTIALRGWARSIILHCLRNWPQTVVAGIMFHHHSAFESEK